MESRFSMLMLFLASRGTYSLLSLSSPHKKAAPGPSRRGGVLVPRSINANSITRGEGQVSSTLDEEASTFWYAVSKKKKKQDDRGTRNRSLGSVPAVPSLDPDGPLPPGAYVALGDASCDPKPTCRVSVALSSSSASDSDVKEIHRLVDSGFTSFQFTNATVSSGDGLAQLFRQVHQQTPRSVMDRVQMTVPIPLSRVVSPKSARTLVMEMLSEFRTNSLDNVQLVFDAADDRRPPDQTEKGKRRPRLLSDGEMYFLDALDALRELQRDGRVRAVSARNLRDGASALAERSGFSRLISSNSVDGSILRRPCVGPRAARARRLVDQPALPAQPGTRIPLLLTSPLAGGFLTGRYAMNAKLPHPWDMTEREQAFWSSQGFYHWYQRRRSSREPRLLPFNPETTPLPLVLWNEYQALLQSLQEVAHGYPGSDIASVALRWLLQRDPEEEHSQAATAHADGLLLPPVAGVVVSSQLRRREEDCFASRAKPSSRAQALRKVFTFSLSDAEMELINSLSGWADDAGADGEMAEAASDGRVRLSL